MPFLIFVLIALLSLSAGFATPSAANDGEQRTAGFMPGHTDVPPSVLRAAPRLNLTMDRSELIRLDEDAAGVVIGNPAHISVLLDTPQTLVVVPQQPGATHFTVLDDRGEVLMARNVIVAAPAENYLRIRRASCPDGECAPMDAYYCPDMCHKINISDERPETDNDDVEVAGEEVAGPENGPAVAEDQP